MPAGINIRPTDQIDDPTWDDVQQRDALIRWLCSVVNGQFEKDGRPDTVLLLDSVDEALTAIEGKTPEPEGDWSTAEDGYTGTLS